MKKKVFLWLLGVIAAVLAVCSLLVGVAFSIREKQETVEYLQIITLKAAQVYEETGDLSLIVRLTDADRVTLIGEGGAVVFDSVADPKEMENHGDRQEVRVAQEGLVFWQRGGLKPFPQSRSTRPKAFRRFGSPPCQKLRRPWREPRSDYAGNCRISPHHPGCFGGYCQDLLGNIVRPLEHTAEKLARGALQACQLFELLRDRPHRLRHQQAGSGDCPVKKIYSGKRTRSIYLARWLRIHSPRRRRKHNAD